MTQIAILSSTILILAVTATNFLAVYSVPNCTFPTDNTLYLSDAWTGKLTDLILGGQIVPGSVSIVWDAGRPDAFYILSVSSTPYGPDTKITFSATENYTDYLDFSDGPRELTSDLQYTCLGSDENDTSVEISSFRLYFTDANNRAPKFNIPDPIININLNTWLSKDPLNFRHLIEFSDQDYNRTNGNLTLRSSSEEHLIDIMQTQASSSRPYTYRYNLYLHPDVRPGNYTVPLTATDGLLSVDTTVQLYIAGGVQAKATALTFLSVLCILTWFN